MSDMTVPEATDSYLTQCQEDLETALLLIDEIEADQDQIDEDLDEIEKIEKDKEDYEKDHPTWWYGKEKINEYNDDIRELENEIDDLEADQQKCEEELAELNGMGDDCEDLFDSLNDANDEAVKVAKSGGNKSNKALDDVQDYVDQILEAIIDQVYANYYAELMEDDSLEMSDYEDYSLQNMQYISQEQFTISSLMSQMGDDLLIYNKNKDSAEIQEADKTFLNDPTGAEKSQDQRDEDCAKKMEALINTLLEDLASVLGGLSSSQFTQLMMVMDNMEQEVIEIINDPNLSITEKTTQILAIVFAMLNYLDADKALLETMESENSQLMSDGMLISSEMQMQDNMANLKIQQEQERNAKTMKIFMTAVVVTLTVVMCMTGQVEMLPLILGFAAYDLAAMWGKAPDMGHKLAQAFGVNELAGAAIWSAIEGVATMGVGMALEKGIAAAAETAAKSAAVKAEAAAETAIKSAVDAAVAQAKADALNAGVALTDTELKQVAQAAENAIRQMVEKTLEKSVETASKLYARQAVGTLISNSFSKTLTSTMEKVSAEAVEQAIQASREIAEQAAKTQIVLAKSATVELKQATENAAQIALDTAKQGTDQAAIEAAERALETETEELATAQAQKAAADALIANSQADLRAAADKAAITAVSNVTGIEAEKVAKAATENVALHALSQTATNTAVAAMGNNMLVDLLIYAMKKTGHKDETQELSFKIAVQVIQALLMMLAIGLQGGGVMFKDSSTTWMLAAGLLTSLGMGATAGADYVQGQDTMDRAETEVAIQINKSLQDMLFDSLSQVQKAAAASRDRWSQEIASDMQQTRYVQQHSLDGAEAGIRVLQASTV